MKDVAKESDTEEEEVEYELSDSKEASFRENVGHNIVTSPNDYNILTLVDFMERDLIKLPKFQRHYEWDIKKASRFIETILFNLPVPAIFLYEKNTDNSTVDSPKYHILDGQQRLLTIYFFVKGIYPKDNFTREKIRDHMINGNSDLRDVIKYNKDFFKDFKLNLPNDFYREKGNYHNEVSYLDLKKNKKLKKYINNFEMFAIRTVVISEKYHDRSSSSIYEIYSRLNSGGSNLSAQQIRASMYEDSGLYDMLYHLNKESDWKKLRNEKSENIRMNDIQALLRSIALLVKNKDYSSPMFKFLNYFSEEFRNKTDILLIKEICQDFFKQSCNFSFSRPEKKKFSVPTFEAVFVAACEEAWKNKDTKLIKKINGNKFLKFIENNKLQKMLIEGTTGGKNVQSRIKLARDILF